MWHKNPGTDKGDQSSDRSQVGYVKEKSKLLVLPNQHLYSQAGGGQRKCHSAQEWSINENSGRQHLLHFLVSTTNGICAKSHKYIVCLWQCELDITSNQHCVTVGLGVGHNTFYSLCACGSVGVGHHPLALSNTVCLWQCGSGTSHLRSIQHCVHVAVWEWDITA